MDESAITGESAPVIRESGGDRSAVTGGTQGAVRPDRRRRSPRSPGETFIDRMIALVEGAAATEDAERDRAEHPARRADDHLHARGGRRCSRWRSTRRHRRPWSILVALLVGADPDHDRRAAVGDRHRRHGPAGPAQRAGRVPAAPVEAAGDVNTLLLDKTGTITIGNRQAIEFLPVDRRVREPSWPTRPSCPAWPTTPRRAGPIVGARQGALRPARAGTRASFAGRASSVEFTAQTRMSGIDAERAASRVRQVRAAAASVGPAVGPRQRRHLRRRSSARWWTASPRSAAPRWWWPSRSTAPPGRSA